MECVYCAVRTDSLNLFQVHLWPERFKQNREGTRTFLFNPHALQLLCFLNKICDIKKSHCISSFPFSVTCHNKYRTVLTVFPYVPNTSLFVKFNSKNGLPQIHRYFAMNELQSFEPSINLYIHKVFRYEFFFMSQQNPNVFHKRNQFKLQPLDFKRFREIIQTFHIPVCTITTTSDAYILEPFPRKLRKMLERNFSTS